MERVLRNFTLDRFNRLRIGAGKLLRDRSAATAVITALGATVLIGLTGLGIDVAYWEVTQRKMQGAADQAAYSAVIASEASNGASPATQAKGITASFGFVDGSNGTTVTVNNPPASGSQTGNNNAFEVIIQQSQPLWFANLFLSSAPTVSARAVAAMSSPGACLIALVPTGSAAINVSGSGTVRLQNCDAYVNSSDTKALQVQGGSTTFDVEDAYIVGGYNASGGAYFNVSKTLKTSASAVADPYASRTAPTIGACGSNPTNPAGGGYNGNYTSPSSPTTIYPGVYCGNLAAGGPLTMSPGVYIIKGGNFQVQGGSSGDPALSGGVCTSPGNKPDVNATGGVTIYMGPDSSGNFGQITVSSCMAITAPTSGNTAGMAFWEGAAAKSDRTAQFNGGANVAVTGAIYVPSATVKFTGSANATTGCTQIVAAIIDMSGTADLQHNCSAAGISDVTGASSGGTAPQLVE